MSVSGSVVAKQVEIKRPKVKLPDLYSGERNKLKAFLLQVELYVGFHPDEFPSGIDKTIWAVSFLRGAAASWIEPFLTDCLENRNDAGSVTTGAKKPTQKLFVSYKGFKEGINKVFGDIDGERTAERTIQNIRQTGSASQYTALFQQYSSQTDWNDSSLKARYYEGLKSIVQDEIARSDRPDSLQEMIELAIRIDNRNYERGLEKRGHYSMGKRQGKKGGSWPQPMELDAAFVKNKISKEETDRRRKLRLCFECGKEGHMASFHRSGGRPQRGGRAGSSYRGRRGGLHATGRQLCATSRKGKNKLDPEDYGTQIEVEVSDSESDASWEKFDKYDDANDESRTMIAESEEEDLQRRMAEEDAKVHARHQAILDDLEGLRKAVKKEQLKGEPEFQQRKTSLVEQFERSLKGRDMTGLSFEKEYRSWYLQRNEEEQASAELAFVEKYGEPVVPPASVGYTGRNVANPRHRLHAELSWVACYSDACEVHREAKEGSGYWPSTRTTVYWDEGEVVTEPVSSSAESKN